MYSTLNYEQKQILAGRIFEEADLKIRTLGVCMSNEVVNNKLLITFHMDTFTDYVFVINEFNDADKKALLNFRNVLHSSNNWDYHIRPIFAFDKGRGILKIANIHLIIDNAYEKDKKTNECYFIKSDAEIKIARYINKLFK